MLYFDEHYYFLEIIYKRLNSLFFDYFANINGKTATSANNTQFENQKWKLKKYKKL